MIYRLLGIVLLIVPLAYLWGLTMFWRKLPSWLGPSWGRNEPELTFGQGIVRVAIVASVFVAMLLGLNLAFAIYPFGIDYHRPNTFWGALLPAVLVELLRIPFGKSVSRKKEPYSAVSDDWLLWNKSSDENKSLAPDSQP